MVMFALMREFLLMNIRKFYIFKHFDKYKSNLLSTTVKMQLLHCIHFYSNAHRILQTIRRTLIPFFFFAKIDGARCGP